MTATEKPNLTLYGLQSQLQELYQLRDEVVTDPELPPVEQKQALDAIDMQIVEYVNTHLARKCDNITVVHREMTERIDAIDDEIARLKHLKQTRERQREHLVDCVIRAMQLTGATRIDGTKSVLSLRKNPPSAEVAQLDMVPNTLMRISVTMPYDLWDALCLKNPRLAACTTKEPEPMKAEILKRLKEGDNIAGCRLRTDGVRLEVK